MAAVSYVTFDQSNAFRLMNTVIHIEIQFHYIFDEQYYYTISHSKFLIQELIIHPNYLKF